MDSHESEVINRRKRRRRPTRLPITAKLTLDEKTKGDCGVIASDLFDDLFGRQLSPLDSKDEVRHIAIAPWRPPSYQLLEDWSWTILPVKAQDTTSDPSTVSVPASSISLQSFAAAVQASKNDLRSKTGIDILLLDVQPLRLQTIFVKVDGEALRRHEEVQKKFGGGFLTAEHVNTSRKWKGKARTTRSPISGDGAGATAREDMESRLRAAIRASLAQPNIVHRNDRLPLPLPAHPITHVPFPPIEVIICEPVDQGLIYGDTKIVIDLDHRGKSFSTRPEVQSRQDSFQSMIAEEDEEDTSNDQFFSAAENGGRRKKQINGNEASEDQISTENSTSEEDNLSDDSDDNMISLNSPALPTQISGFMSSKDAATPRIVGMNASGIRTPGSVFSNYTATTARQGMQMGRPFRVKPLTLKVPDTMLHPRPSNDEDDEARVFVDVKMLVRLGCFSGDWVKLIASHNLGDGKEQQLWPLSTDGEDEPHENFRAVKIYGIPDAPGNDVIQYPKTEFARSMSHGSILPISRPTPNAYLSPILFENMGKPRTMHIAPLLLASQDDKKFSKSKIPNSAIPPIAREVNLLRLPTPLSTERTAQAGLFANLKKHFEKRRRILRTGDLVAISVDAGASKLFSDAGTGTDPDNDLEELLATPSRTGSTSSKDLSVAWFKVGLLSGTRFNEENAHIDPGIWGGVSSIEPMNTKMVQSGNFQHKVPPLLEVPWAFYLGARKIPRPALPSSSPLNIQDSHPKPYIGVTRRRIREFLAASTSQHAIRQQLSPTVILLHSTQRHIGKAQTTMAACEDLGLHVFPIDSYDILTEGAGGGDVKTEASLRAKVERALTCGATFTIPLLQHVEALTADRMSSTLKDLLQDLRALVMTTTEIEKVPESIRSLVTHEIEISAPDESEREGILNEIVNNRSIKLAYDVDLKAVALKTAALVAGDLVDVVERAIIARQERVELLSPIDSDILIRDIYVAGGSSARCITKPDFNVAVEAARKNFADSIGAPKIPNVSWDDVGGLTNVKDAVMETIQLPLERPELFAKGMKKRSGILFYGPPGTGKTLLAKAIATEFSLNFFSVKGPELLNMYIGESEANVRRVFQRARDARPCVVFFDELDSVAPKRGNQGDSGGVMDRIVSQLLAELDGMSNGDGGGGGVFVIGATNRPDLLDQALLRPGRFDKMLYLGVSDTHDKQLTIIEALTRKFTLHPDTSLGRIAETLPFTYTGADLYALCSDAMLKAITRQASAVDAKIKNVHGGLINIATFFDHYATDEDIAVMVTEDDFYAAQRELVGSVSAKELEHYKRVRQTFEGSPQSPQPRQPPNGAVHAPNISAKEEAVRHVSSAKAKPQANEKGKGKVQHEEEDDDDDAYVTSNDYGSPYRSVNGSARGKGEAVRHGFHDPSIEDEDDMYS